MDKDAIFAEVKDLFAETVLQLSDHGNCYLWAFVGRVVFYRHGVYAALQAGSAAWPTPTGYIGCVFDETMAPDTPDFQRMIEVHAWLYIPTSREIVDFSLHEMDSLYREQEGHASGLPDYAWFAGASPYTYRPSVNAGKVTKRMIARSAFSVPEK